MITSHEAQVEIRCALQNRIDVLEQKVEDGRNRAYWLEKLRLTKETKELFDHHTIINGLQNLEKQEQLQNGPR